MSIPDIEYPTVAAQIFSNSICKYSVPQQITSDQCKKFAINISKELFLELEAIRNTEPSPVQCSGKSVKHNGGKISLILFFNITANLGAIFLKVKGR